MIDHLPPPAAVIYAIVDGRHVPAILTLAPLDEYTAEQRELAAVVWHFMGGRLILAAPS